MTKVDKWLYIPGTAAHCQHCKAGAFLSHEWTKEIWRRITSTSSSRVASSADGDLCHCRKVYFSQGWKSIEVDPFPAMKTSTMYKNLRSF